MEHYQNPKVVGSFIVGFALVAGTYLLSNFGQPRLVPGTLYAVASEAPPRVFVEVRDSNNDGIEDWREQFVTAPPVTIIDTESFDYAEPTTYTDRLGVSIMEGVVTSQVAGPIARSRDQVISDSLTQLSRAAGTDRVYDYRDIVVTRDVSSESIRRYGNTLADILIQNSVPGLDHEFQLLERYLVSNDQQGMADLERLTESFKLFRDLTLNTPVPEIFAKEHLDLVNVYNALYQSGISLTKATEDPMLPFLRLKRHEDDMLGLSMSLNNMYDALVPHARVFEQNDSVLLLVSFSQNYQ